MSSPRPDSRARAAAAGAAGACFAAVWAVFLPALRNGLVNWSDLAVLIDNPRLHAALRSPVEPLRWLVYAVVLRAAGLDARAFHAAGVLVHALNAALLCELTRRLLLRARPQASPVLAAAAACAGTLLWAVHPLEVEAAAWATALTDGFSALLALLATLAYVGAQSRPKGAPRAAAAAAAFVLFLLAALTRWRALCLPALWLILDFWPLRRFDGPRGAGTRRALVEKLPLFALAGALAALAAQAKGVSAARTPLAGPGEASARVLFYLKQLVWPARLLPAYSWDAVDPHGWLAPAGPFLLIGVTAALGWLARRHRGLLAGWLAFLAALFPTVCLTQAGPALASDHYAYLALMPLAGAAGFALLSARRRAAAFAVAAAALVLLAAQTRRQLARWRDSQTLWARTLELDPRSPVARVELAAAELDEGKTMEALALYDEQMRLFPEDRLAALAAARLRPRAADLEGDPSAGELMRGAALYDDGRLEQALGALRRAVALAPESPQAWMDLGLLLYRQDRLDEAQTALERAVSLAPMDADIRNDYGIVLARQGRLDQAIAQFRKAVGLAPRAAQPRVNLRDALELKRGSRRRR